MNVRIIAQVKINAKPAAVFEYLAEPKYHTLWNPQLQQVAPLSRLRTGSTYKSTSLMLGVEITGKNEVSKCLAGKALEIQNNTGLLQYRVQYQLHKASDSTLVRCITNVGANNHAFAFAKPVLKLLGQREIQSDLRALKIAVEQRLNPL